MPERGERVCAEGHTAQAGDAGPQGAAAGWHLASGDEGHPSGREDDAPHRNCFPPRPPQGQGSSWGDGMLLQQVAQGSQPVGCGKGQGAFLKQQSSLQSPGIIFPPVPLPSPLPAVEQQ